MAQTTHGTVGLRVTSRPSRLLISLVLECIAALILAPRDLQAGKTEATRRLWSVDLSEDPDFAKRLPQGDLVLRRPSVVFLDQNLLLLGYDDNFRSIDEETSRMRAFGYHIVEIDAETGSRGASRSFQVLNALSDIKPLGSGQFVLLQSERLTKFSSAFRQLAEIATPLRLHGEPTPLQIGGGRTGLYPEYEKWQVDVSPDLSSLVLVHMDRPEELELHWLDTQDLREFGSTTVNGSIRYGSTVSAGNRNAILDFSSRVPQIIDRPVLIDMAGRKTFLCPKCKNSLDVRFLSNQVVYWAERQAMNVVLLPDSLVLRQELRGKPIDFSKSANATRFAVAVAGRRGTGEISILVFDWSTKKRIVELPVAEAQSTQLRTDLRQCTIALSPDGKRLVVLLGSRLLCYQLP